MEPHGALLGKFISKGILRLKKKKKARPRGGGEHLSFLLGNEAIKPVGLHTSYVRVAQSLDELGKPVQNLIK